MAGVLLELDDTGRRLEETGASILSGISLCGARVECASRPPLGRAEHEIRIMSKSLDMLVHGRLMLGIAHGCVDKQRQEDNSRQVIVEPLFVTQALEPQRDGRRGSSE